MTLLPQLSQRSRSIPRAADAGGTGANAGAKKAKKSVSRPRSAPRTPPKQPAGPRLTLLPPEVLERIKRFFLRLWGCLVMGVGGLVAVALFSYSPRDPSLNTASNDPVQNLLGLPGSTVSDVLVQSFGLVSVMAVLVLVLWGLRQTVGRTLPWLWLRGLSVLGGSMVLALCLSFFSSIPVMPLPSGNGGFVGQLLQDGLFAGLALMAGEGSIWADIMTWVTPLLAWVLATVLISWGLPIRWYKIGQAWSKARQEAKSQAPQGDEIQDLVADRDPLAKDEGLQGVMGRLLSWGPLSRFVKVEPGMGPNMGAEPAVGPREPHMGTAGPLDDIADADLPPWVSSHADPDDIPELVRTPSQEEPRTIITPPTHKAKRRDQEARQGSLPLGDTAGFHLPPLELLTPEDHSAQVDINEEILDTNARMLETVLQDFGIKGRIVEVRPGPVVTLYELDPAPGTKTSRVVALADDIARSMSAISVRIAVVPGKSTIGIELPNQHRQMVNFRALLADEAFHKSKSHLTLALGQDIGGTPVMDDLAKMPHLLIAGTTGSGKSVAVNTMICSLLYSMTPEQCRFIMIDPKMLELSVYDGIPHLLTPVVTNPGKAVVALKWAVKEMEERYRAMSEIGVRNIHSFNTRVREAIANGETLTRRVQIGFAEDNQTPVFEEQELASEPIPFIVVIVDEMADLMIVAGKEVEAAIQRLAQMARAAGIHLIMATQRPSVDVITGTIKANFPSRISFQVTSKIDSRTILGEQGAEQLLGQGDMLYMAGGGKTTRIHGPFISDQEVEQIVTALCQQGQPSYVNAVVDENEQGTSEVLDRLVAAGNAASCLPSSGDDLFDKVVALVATEQKVSISFIQRHFSIGYNRAAKLVEQMEKEGMISAAGNTGRRDIFLPKIDPMGNFEE